MNANAGTISYAEDIVMIMVRFSGATNDRYTKVLYNQGSARGEDTQSM